MQHAAQLSQNLSHPFCTKPETGGEQIREGTLELKPASTEQPGIVQRVQGFCQMELSWNPASFTAISSSFPYLWKKWGSMTLSKFFNPTELVSFPQENKGQMSYHLQKKHLINCKLLNINVLGANNLVKATCGRIHIWSPDLSGPRHIPVAIITWYLLKIVTPCLCHTHVDRQDLGYSWSQNVTFIFLLFPSTKESCYHSWRAQSYTSAHVLTS